MKSYKTGIIIALLNAGLLFVSPIAYSQDQIYGSQLMTQQERIEHRNKMRNLKTEQERERYRIEHHKKMQERAKAKGLSLPDKPPSSGKGMMNNDGRGFGSGSGGRGR